MSNSFSNERIERQVFDKLVDRYNDLIKGVKLYGYPLPKNSYSPSVTASKPMIDYQLVYQEDLKYEKSDTGNFAPGMRQNFCFKGHSPQHQANGLS